jgi:PAT family beta-lactamase induction signal transducer AmpG
MWASKLVGISAGGAGLAIVIATAGLSTAVALQAVVILCVCLLVIVARERAGERLLPWSAGSAQGAIGKQQFGLNRTFSSLKTALSRRTPLTLVFVALTAFVCEGLYDPLTTEFFVQHLGWSAAEFAGSQGTIGVTGEMIGALSGGYLASRFGGRPVAMLGICLVMGTLLTFSLTSFAWESQDYPHIALLPAFRGCLAFSTVALFSLYMQSCWTIAAATQFTLYMALNNLAHWAGARLNGWLPAIDLDLDYAQLHLLGGLLPLVALGLLATIDVSEDKVRGESLPAG